MTKPEIPYDAIDPEIRDIVRAISDCPWLLTVVSCQGHAPKRRYQYPYVALRCEADKVGCLLATLDHAFLEQQGEMPPSRHSPHLVVDLRPYTPTVLYHPRGASAPEGGLYLFIEVKHYPYTDAARRNALRVLERFAALVERATS